MTATRTIPATDREAAIASLARLVASFLPGRELTVTVDEAKRERSAKQRASLFGVAYAALMPQMGLRGERDKEQLHDFMCGEYFGWRNAEFLGKPIRRPARTTTTNERGEKAVISVREQMDFYAFIQQRAAEYGYDVPDPDPEWYRRAERDAEIDARAA